MGLVALVDPGAGGGPFEIYFARLIVDAALQGRGFGTKAVELVIRHARGRPGCTGVRLTHAPSNSRVGRFYERFGFRYTGAIDSEGEIEMRLAFSQ